MAQNCCQNVDSCSEIMPMMQQAISKLSTNRKKYVSVAHEPKYIKLLQWMKSKGFDNKSAYVLPADFSDTGRGLLSKRYVRTGEHIISVPQNLLMTTVTVFHSYLGRILHSWPEKFSPVQVISIFLLCERQKGQQSFWAPYIGTLPESYTNATYWHKEDISLLPEFVQSLAVSQCDDVRKSFDKMDRFLSHLQKELPQMESITFSDYQWAWSTINTRSVYMVQEKNIFLNGDIDHFALVPLLDLLNHSANVEVSAGFDQLSESYLIKAVSPIAKYHQAFINYGPHSNAKLLVEYGFILLDNPNNFIPVNLDTLSLFAKKMEVLQCEEKLKIISENEKHRDMYFSKDGTSWNLSIALMMLCLSHLNMKDMKVVLSGQHLSKSHDIKLQNLTAKLLQMLREDMLESLRQKQTSVSVETLKTNLARSLHEDCLQILEECAHLYKLIK